MPDSYPPPDEDEVEYRRPRVLDALPKHPTQPLVVDEQTGHVHFRMNKIVRFLLDTSKNNLNELHLMPFSDDDFEQLAMLTGYSASGFGELSSSDPERVAQVDAEAEKIRLAWKAQKGSKK